MDKESKWRIKHIEGIIYNKEFTWDLNPDINFIVGPNGCGKTTVLKNLDEVIFDNMYNDYEEDLPTFWNPITKIVFEGSSLSPGVMYLNPSEITLKDLVDKMFTLHNVHNRCTPIDILVKEKMMYMNQDEIRKLHESLTNFIGEQRMDSFSDVKHDTSYLSIGEKHLVYILTSVILTGDDHTILLLDNPDSYLNISWQHHLLDEILHLNPNIQIICATNSPDLIGGLYDKTLEL